MVRKKEIIVDILAVIEYVGCKFYCELEEV